MIELSKNKIVYVTDHYNPDCEKYEKKEVECLHPYLNETVELSDDFTLEDFFRILGRERGVMGMTFSSHLGHYPLQLYIDEIEKPPTDDDDEDEIKYLELRRYGELWDWGDLDLFIDFSGLGKEHEGGGVGYAIEYTPLNELKHLPLRLNTDVEISEAKIPSKMLVKGTMVMSVYELISTILCEISFAGSPELRDKQLTEITGAVKEMREVLGEPDNEEG